MESADVLFDLNEAQLLSVLEGIVGKPLTEWRVEPKPDGKANHHLCTFRYVTGEGETGETRVFVKRCVWKGRSEAVHYRYLAAQGVPTPRIYGALHNTSGEEILFLEALISTGFRAESDAEWRALLSLLARLNSCSITPDYVPHLHPYEQGGTIEGRWWLLGLNASPEDAEIEANLRMCGVANEEILRFVRASQILMAQVAAQPKGLLHQDFLPDNVGWRGAREEMVVFDLHKNAAGPRFADVAPYLAWPDWSTRCAFLDAVETDGRSRREKFIEHYLREYARFGGSSVSREAFQEETTALFWSHKVASLDWLFRAGQQTRITEVLTFLSDVA